MLVCQNWIRQVNKVRLFEALHVVKSLLARVVKLLKYGRIITTILYVCSEQYVKRWLYLYASIRKWNFYQKVNNHSQF